MNILTLGRRRTPGTLAVGCAVGLWGAVLSSASAWGAVEYARVVSRTPVLEQVITPREACRDQAATVQTGTPIAGTAVGGTTGYRIESARPARVFTTRRCVTEQIIENRIAAYDVIYELGGKRYTVRLAQDPGDTLAIELMPRMLGAPAGTTYVTVPVPVQHLPRQTGWPGVQYVYVQREWIPYRKDHDNSPREREGRKHPHNYR